LARCEAYTSKGGNWTNYYAVVFDTDDSKKHKQLRQEHDVLLSTRYMKNPEIPTELKYVADYILPFVMDHQKRMRGRCGCAFCPPKLVDSAESGESRRRRLMHRLNRLSRGNSFDLDSPLQAEDGLAKRE